MRLYTLQTNQIQMTHSYQSCSSFPSTFVEVPKPYKYQNNIKQQDSPATAVPWLLQMIS